MNFETFIDTLISLLGLPDDADFDAIVAKAREMSTANKAAAQLIEWAQDAVAGDSGPSNDTSEAAVEAGVAEYDHDGSDGWGCKAFWTEEFLALAERLDVPETEQPKRNCWSCRHLTHPMGEMFNYCDVMDDSQGKAEGEIADWYVANHAVLRTADGCPGWEKKP
jgi:hypothetical protein